MGRTPSHGLDPYSRAAGKPFDSGENDRCSTRLLAGRGPEALRCAKRPARRTAAIIAAT